jgi:hypothetical protein
MIFDKAKWQECIKGFSIFDCAITRADRVFFTLVENKPDRDIIPITRFLHCMLDHPLATRFYYRAFDQFSFTYMAFATEPNRELLAVDVSGHTYSYSANHEGLDSELESPWLNNHIIKDNMRSSIRALKRVNGVVYALASERQIFKREAINRWHTLTNTPEGIPFPMKTKPGGGSATSMGMKDLSAFSPSDMYAAGGKGDLWHYNGKAWKQISFPSNELLSTICCAGDGQVYITGQNGSLWAGRDDSWTKLQDGEISLPFKDSEWFAGKLYCGNDYGLWVKDEKNQLIPLRDAFEDDASMNSDIAMSSGRIDISPDGTLMLTAGPQGASLYDGKKWELLFNSNLMR